MAAGLLDIFPNPKEPVHFWGVGGASKYTYGDVLGSIFRVLEEM